ncbi:Maf-like protein [Clostridium bovifaecis]|uniref:dTTP/UTP pyrophosphatase n=1 Tax=Clostridium bovifaecis TaxID=2184719 RepID=A0A6I6F395_9CLOT|nr:Maf-like protein [Clostridium bovifaecis]
MKLILASASERRQELLKRITSDFDIIVSDFDEEKVSFQGSCGEYVTKLAKGKAENVANRIGNDAIVIGCDTIVSFKEHVLGKPRNELEAFSMLRLLSGSIHQVYSGVAVIDTKTKNVKIDYVCTDVKFSSISDEEIKSYIATGEPMDKAGAYGIQGFGGVFVEEITGDYYNVVGLPLNKLNKMLKEMGVNL